MDGDKRIEKASIFLNVDEHTIEEQLHEIDRILPPNRGYALDVVSKVQVIELFENTFTIQDFLETIN